jgi:hypothetical protein
MKQHPSPVEPPRKQVELPPLCFSIDEFCRCHRMSKATLYKLWKDGVGPKAIKLPGSGKSGRRLISVEAAQEWREQMGQRDVRPSASIKEEEERDVPPSAAK